MRRASVVCAAFLVAAVVLSASGQAAPCAPPQTEADGWAVGTPDSVGLDAGRLCALVPRALAFRQADVHAVLVVRHDKLVFEQYFRGPDEVWGRSLGDIPHGRDQLHDARSVTKSVVALVLGIALDRGMIKGNLDTPIFDLLPQYADLRSREQARITVRDLLTMSAGFEWDEEIPYGDPRNSETEMDRSADPARFVLSQPVVDTPGQVYNYSGGSAVLIAAILKQATGRTLDVPARELLFAPLGISDVAWVRYPTTGAPVAASGLRLRPRDFAKIGQLVLAHGVWKGKQIVPTNFLAEATAPQINGQGLYFYGYQFWLGRSLVNRREIDWSGAVGLGGQRIFIVPALDLVVVINAGLYSSPLQGRVPLGILNRYVLAAAEPVR